MNREAMTWVRAILALIATCMVFVFLVPLAGGSRPIAGQDAIFRAAIGGHLAAAALSLLVAVALWVSVFRRSRREQTK
jgi:uncharacterized membrane protein YidH (DUF202 family)